ncbi:hypothetical protein RE428_31930 [Marinobacter nanhaiticus D15-8W]|uniref:Uncharacterized protein n=1 Tax=Marinobacter nanhaiticus D15-8W TaxID=626887 RepID=N6X0I6_9GAMM|nr:hypothetical protein [Marinobacter nanhaiticus]ENO16952.1 hypothetical protein J057_01735 [Marinobacter nanhaiticus D15-8W]BES72175.1 hypothetical protein RE428_31930 [Marinobacter nanhaiticus D15-8W]
MTQTIGCTAVGSTAQSQARITDEAPYIATLNAAQVLDKVFIYSEGGSGTGTFDLGIYRAFDDLGNSPLLFQKNGISFTVPASAGWVEITTGLGDDLSALEGEVVTVTCNNLSGFTGRQADGVITASSNGRRNGSATALNDPFGGFSTTSLNSFYITTEDAVTEIPGLPSYNLNKDGADQASKSGIQVRVVAGTALNGTQLYYSNSVTTDANGDTSPIDLSSSAAAVNDTVTVTILTGDGYGIPFTDTVEDIS